MRRNNGSADVDGSRMKQEEAVAKGQKRSNREKKKPKQSKPVSLVSKSTSLGSSMQSLGSSMTRGSKTPIKGKF
jgi:hypothetical protein